MIRSINLLSILALIIAVASGSYLYYTRNIGESNIESAIKPLKADIGSNNKEITTLQTDMKTQYDKANAKNEAFAANLATANSNHIALDKNVTALGDEIKSLEGKLDETNKALKDAKPEIVKAAIDAINKQKSTDDAKAKTAKTIGDLKATQAGEEALKIWTAKFSLLSEDYITLNCYDEVLFWQFISGNIMTREPQKEISTNLATLAAIDVSTLDEKGITELNTNTQPKYDGILEILTNAGSYIEKKKGGKSKMVKATEKCGALKVVGK